MQYMIVWLTMPTGNLISNIKSYNTIIWLLFGLGAGLRLLLFWANPPDNAYDNHFEPIFFIMKYGFVPPLDACWQCYQPPLFYYLSAQIGEILVKVGASDFQVMKALQSLSCIFDISNLIVIYLILKKLPLSGFSRLIAFATVCFLPVHIYMAAIHSNDTITYFLVSVCLYLAIEVIDTKFSLLVSTALGIALTLTLFTKYTALSVLPAISAVWVVTFFFSAPIVPRKKIVTSFLLAMLIPIIIISYQARTNEIQYGKPFPMNIDFFEKKHNQVPGDNISFLSFKPLDAIVEPILSPLNVKSFWTVIYGRMWFDMEPKFLYFTDNYPEWWKRYFDYLHGTNPIWPGIGLSSTTLLLGAILIVLGLLPLILIVLGGLYWLFGYEGSDNIVENKTQRVKAAILLTLFICNAAGIVMFTSKYPVFSFMKASYFLNSLASFAGLLGAGILILEKRRIFRIIFTGYFSFLYLVVTFHILLISASLLL